MENTPFLNKRDRLQRIFNLLLALHHKCSCVEEAYNYLSLCFYKIEEKYCDPEYEYMHLKKLKEFRQVPEYGIYICIFHSHVLFLHEDGAYAIYDKIKEWEFNPMTLVDSYLALEPRVIISDTQGKDVWDSVPLVH